MMRLSCKCLVNMKENESVDIVFFSFSLSPLGRLLQISVRENRLAVSEFTEWESETNQT